MRSWILLIIVAALSAFAAMQLDRINFGILLTLCLGAITILYAYVLVKSFYLACIKGVEPPPPARSAHPIDQKDLPGPVWDALQRLDPGIDALNAEHLGYMRIELGFLTEYSSVWWADDGRTVMYSSVSVLPWSGRAAKPSATRTTCSSSLLDGTVVQTINSGIPQGDLDSRYRALVLPKRFTPETLLTIHTARLDQGDTRCRPIDPLLDRVVQIKNEEIARMQDSLRAIMGTRDGADGRQRMGKRAWLSAVFKELPPMGTVRRIVDQVRVRRELRALGLAHLWTKPH